MNAQAIALVVALLGWSAAPDSDKEKAPFTLRLDGIHEVLSGGDDPLKIGIGADGALRRGTLAYLTTSFLGMTSDKKKEATRPKARDLLGADKIPITVEFPHADVNKGVVRVKGSFAPDACCGRSLEGFVRVPDEARSGDVNIVIFWDAANHVKGGRTSLLVHIKK